MDNSSYRDDTPEAPQEDAALDDATVPDDDASSQGSVPPPEFASVTERSAPPPPPPPSLGSPVTTPPPIPEIEAEPTLGNRTELTPPPFRSPPRLSEAAVVGPRYVRPPEEMGGDPLPPPPTGPPRDPFAQSPSISLEASRQYTRHPIDPTPVTAVRPSKDRPFWKAVLLALVSAAIGAAVAVAVYAMLDEDPAPVAAVGPPITVIERVVTEIVDSSAEPSMVAPAVAKAVIPSIVTVEIDTVGGAVFLSEGSGSGVVLDTEGHIVTNEHVVAGAESVRVVFADGRVYTAEIVGTDKLTDLAVLVIDAIGLTPIEVGTSRDLAIGEPAIAVGSPLGLQGGPSLTVGVISAFDRQVRTGPDPQADVLFGMLQTDAPINRGSSGGALVDGQGRLIGITSAIGVSSVGAEGLGFAIPVELVGRVAAEIIETGEAKHAFLGIGGETAFEGQADGAEIPVGVLVISFEGSSAADAAGLRVGDRIISLNGENVTTMDGLIIALRNFRVGETVSLSIDRGTDSIVIPVELGERDN